MRFVATMLFALIGATVYSQSRQITGRLVDEETQKGIAGATVSLVDPERKTITNQLGYFSLAVNPSDDAIIISSIGFIAGKIAVPPDNVFKAPVKRDYVTLIGLDLDTFPVEDLEPHDSTSARVTERIKANAEYPGGWQNFYNDFASELHHRSYSSVIPDSIRHILFTVSNNGSITDIRVPDGTDSLKLIVDLAFKKLKAWQPARQNHFTTAQHFELPFQWTKRMRPEDIMPASPLGGSKKFYDFVARNIKYPVKAKNRNVTGKVYVGFFVERDGSLSGVRAVKGIGWGCDEEAVRVVSLWSKWNPGTHKGQPMRQYFTLPISFAIDGVITPDNSRGFPKSYYEWMVTNTQYTSQAKRLGVEGTVLVSFKISKATGRIDSIRLLDNIEGDCGREVIRVLKTVPSEFLSSLVTKDSRVYQPVHFRLDPVVEKPVEDNKPGVEVLYPILITGNTEAAQPTNDTGDRFELARGQEFQWFDEILAYLNDQGFESFDDALAGPTNKLMRVYRLQIVRKNVEVVPPEIKNLRNLRLLDIEGNKIQSLPREIGALKKLEALNAPQNELKDLPIELGNLKSMKILVLANNKFKEFPKPTLLLAGLTTLDLSGNLITSLPVAIGDLRKLDHLHLQNNSITSIPEEFYLLTQLKVLTIGGNDLTEADKQKLRERLKKTDVKFE
jgi:TonB family protein